MKALPTALLLVLAATVALAGDGIRQEIDAALARGDRDAALATLDAVIRPDAPRDRQLSLDAALAAMDAVKGPEGNLRAARILVDTLSSDSSNSRGAYTLAMNLNARAREAFDLAARIELLRGLVRIYPDKLEFSGQLARVYRHAGLPALALEEYARIARLAPSDRDARQQLALLHEEEGDIEAALGVYDDLIDLHANDPRPDLGAHLSKAKVLLAAHDYARARQALAAGVAAAERSAEQRDEYLARFESLRSSIEEDVAHGKTLRELRTHLHGALWATAAAWAVVLGGGLTCLRRAKWI